MEDRYVEVGRIIGRFKLENKIKVESLLDTVEELLKLNEYYIKTLTGFKKIDLYVESIGPNHLIYKVENFNPKLIDHLKGKLLFTHYKNLPKLKENQFYIADLEDCRIYDSTEKEIAPLKRILTDGKNYFLEFLDYIIPFTKRYVKSVDIQNKKIVLTEIFFQEKDYLK
ncbi:MAG: ribosome maturation factor RimM [Brevinematia bacterium]